MNVSKNNMNMFSVFSQRFGQSSMMKSTREKLQRQEKAQSQIEYWEGQKESLKEMECDTVEEIAKKLEKFHSYEDQIAAVKQAYNFEQMHHVLDEAQEQGEKIAEAADKTKPKTEEERKKEAAEEAAGTEDTGGMLGDMLDEMTENLDELTEALTEELPEALAEELPEMLAEELPEELPEALAEELPEELSEALAEELPDALVQSVAGEPARHGTEESASKLPEESQQDIAGEEQLPERQAQKLVREHQRYQELARDYANMASDREDERRAQFDYRM